MLRRISIAFALLTCGCQKAALPTASRPASKPAMTKPTTHPAPVAATRPAEKDVHPKRPKPSWVIFRAAIDEDKDATCISKYDGGRRIEVHTDNIRVLSLDVSKLPSGSPEAGPWNLQIDRQGIQITGLRGNLKVLDLIQSRNGEWSVVPGSHRPRL